MATVIPRVARAWRVWSWKEATDWPWRGTAAARPSRVWMRSWWSMKSKSMVKIGLPSTWPMGRVVVPRPVRWNGTFHQWLRRLLAASRSLPTTWQNRCRVCLVSCQAARGIGGNSSMPALQSCALAAPDVQSVRLASAMLSRLPACPAPSADPGCRPDQPGHHLGVGGRRGVAGANLHGPRADAGGHEAFQVRVDHPVLG